MRWYGRWRQMLLVFWEFFSFIIVLAMVVVAVIIMTVECLDSGDGGGFNYSTLGYWKLYMIEYATAFGFTFFIASVQFLGVISFLFCDNTVFVKFFCGRRAELRQEQNEQEALRIEQEEQDKEKAGAGPSQS